ncbi:MAG: dihydroorotase [Ferruginibacter sp.]|nr:dihydroorotase [Cytophagales bacterium]
MRILIRSAEIVDPASPFHGQRKDILVEDGVIRRVGEGAETGVDYRLEGAGRYVSTGWVDMRVSAKDPGQEQKEDLSSVVRAAAAGGFTEIAVLPNTQPVVQTKEAIAYQKRAGERGPVRIHPIAAVTLNHAGKELTEMIDLHRAGAVAFSDGTVPLWHADVFVKTLQYLQPLGGLLINRPEDPMLTRYGTMNEGLTSTMLGLKGMPKLAEELMLMRDLALLEYVTEPDGRTLPKERCEAARDGRTPDGPGNVVLHFSLISTARSVALIREAKRNGWPVSCDVAAHQIAFHDSALVDFDTNLKVNPPFRSPEDVAALWEGLADGTIDAIVSDHNPQDEESKKLEFDLAEFGVIGLETAFAVVNTHNPGLPLFRLVEKLTTQPRRILRLPPPRIEEGQPANLTFFDAHVEWTFTEADIRSKSGNSPFIGHRFKGRPLATMINGQLSIIVDQ